MSKIRQGQKKRTRILQTDLPRFTLEKALIIARVLWEQFAGKSAEPVQIALALDLAPTSGHWRNLCGASIAYGLTEGGLMAFAEFERDRFSNHRIVISLFL